MKKRFLAIIALVVFVVLTMVPTAFAASQSYGNSTVYVDDLGDLLSISEENDLMTYFGGLFADRSYNILFLTTNDADGKSTMVWSDDYMDSKFPYDENNIAFVIDMDNREIYINTMGNATLCLTDNMIDKALDKGYNYISDYQYYDCLKAMADYCETKLNDNPGTGARDDDTMDVIAEGAINGLIPGGVVTGILCFILVMNHNKANKVQSATAYIGKDNYEVKDKNEVFVRSYERVHHDYYKPKSSSSGGGGGSSHRSSSGRSHGGGGRRF